MHQEIDAAMRILKTSHQQAFQRHVENVLQDELELAQEAKKETKRSRLLQSKSHLQKQILSNPNAMILPNETIYVVQRFIKNPLLIQGYKFDLKLFALVTSCNPLTIYLYEDGLASFGEQPFAQDLIKRVAGLNPEST